MYKLEVILAVWKRHRAANIHSPQIKKADAFFGLIAGKQDDCWEELAGEFRINYYDVYELIAQTLLGQRPIKEGKPEDELLKFTGTTKRDGRRSRENLHSDLARRGPGG